MLVSVNREMSIRIDNIFANTVTLLHEGVEIVACRVHSYPARMILFVSTIHRSN